MIVWTTLPMRLWMHLPVPLRRVGYRLAFALLRIYWFVFRPSGGGVKCVLTGTAGVLLVRHTYGPRYWDLPGGTLKSGEPPRIAATREMQEEMGITIDDWTPLGDVQTRIHHRHDALHCFQARIDGSSITIDRGEIAAAQWFELQDLPLDLARYVRPILARLSAEF